ncbi:RNA polymerase sigma factor SigZ [Propionivibrio soli]|uniref:RNA polymerase sigma factor SigZ n=1 Tax=Propionivibrio soli TaxID=2976531 RepID=UPI0021E9A03C|nr:RNA polymerase sigma factor SigZ [Propionivibrio soli]
MDGKTDYQCLNKAWRAHKKEIRSFLVHRMGDAAAADDLLQELFLKALMLGRGFCDIDNRRAWLFQVARNLLVDRLRLEKDHAPLPDDVAAEPLGEVAPVDLLSHCLPRVLSELSPEDREAIVLCDIQGVTQKDFADRHGISLPGAKSRVQRARQRLQAQLVSACKVTFDEAGKVCCFVPRPPLQAPLDSSLEPSQKS